MNRIALRAVITTALVATAASSTAGQQYSTATICGSGVPTRPYLGIGTYHCRGGTCLVNGLAASVGENSQEATATLKREAPGGWAFTVEPRLFDLSGSAATRLRTGDVLLAVDGDPITTRRAGMRLAELHPGDTLVLTVRRRVKNENDTYDVTLDVPLVPRDACATPVASAGPSDAPLDRPGRTIYWGTTGAAGPANWSFASVDTAWRAIMPSARRLYSSGALILGDSSKWTAFYGRLRPAVEYGGRSALTGSTEVRLERLGLSLAAPHQTTVLADGTVRWRFSTLPTVASIDQGGRADRAGVERGDVIESAGSASVLAFEGVAALTRPVDESVTLVVRRGDSTRTVVVR